MEIYFGRRILEVDGLSRLGLELPKKLKYVGIHNRFLLVHYFSVVKEDYFIKCEDQMPKWHLTGFMLHSDEVLVWCLSDF